MFKELIIGAGLLVAAYFLYNWSANNLKAQTPNAAKQASELGLGVIIEGIALLMAIGGIVWILSTLICGPSKNLA